MKKRWSKCTKFQEGLKKKKKGKKGFAAEELLQAIAISV